jgi:hypothetical protein
LQLHLIEQTCGQFRARSENFAPQLRDLKLQMGDQSLFSRGCGLGGGGVRFGEDASVALGGQRRFQRFEVIGKGIEIGVHDLIRS